MTKITEEKVAREAGVSKASVSRFFNPRETERLRPGTKARILPVVEKYGFEPERRVVVKRKHKTGVFGLMVSFSTDIVESWYHSRIFSGIIASMERSDYDLRLIPVRDEDYLNIRRFLQRYLIDGMFILTWRSHPNLIKLVEAFSKPFPLILFNDYDPKTQAHFVYCDVSWGMEKAVEFLVKKERKKIAFLKGPFYNRVGHGEGAIHVESLDSMDKFRGFRKALKAHGLEARPGWLLDCSCYSREEGHKRAEGLFGRHERPDAILCSNDALALGALDHLKERGIACPEEVAVIGFDGVKEGEYANPPLTTVVQPLKEMGEEAGKQLIALAEGRMTGGGYTQIRFKPELVIRKSA